MPIYTSGPPQEVPVPHRPRRAEIMKRSAFFLLAACATQLCPAAEVITETWPTQNGSPPATLAGDAARMLPAFRLAVRTLSESSVVNLALSQPAVLGLSAQDAALMKPLFAARYRLLNASPIYRNAPSPLPYCFNSEIQTRGSASVYLPDDPAHAEGVIVFLHGVGGSFLWYQHLLSETFPKHIILCPAYGIAPHEIPPKYVFEAMDTLAARLGHPLPPAVLIGLSAGACGGGGVFAAEPARFSRLICLGSFPPSETMAAFPARSDVRFMAGALEPFVESGDLAKIAAKVQAKSPHPSLSIVPAANHFFLLTHQEEALRVLRPWIAPAPAPASP